MNLDLPVARRLVSELRARLPADPPVDIAVCPPSIYLFPMAKAVADSPIQLGAQNCWHEKSGAFTGEVSAEMIAETGCRYVILGHSDRRHTIGPRDGAGRVAGESDALVAAKCRSALSAGLIPIVCVGETLEEREAGRTEAVLAQQVDGSLEGVEVADPAALVIAYEPVWAIGTGRNATAEQAQAAHRFIRERVSGRLGAGIAEGIRIQYGGSVKPDNALDLLSCPDVDGALVGGASLTAGDFGAIVEQAVKAKR